MAKWDVTVEGATYEVDAPDERTAWLWANQYHKQSPQKPKKATPLLERALDFIPSLGDAATRGIIEGASRALTGIEAPGAGLSSLAGREQEATSIFKSMEDRQSSTEQFLNEMFPSGGSLSEKVMGGAAQIPYYLNPLTMVPSIVGTGVEEQQRANKSGVDSDTAKRAGYLGAGVNAALAGLPGSGLVKGAIVGGGTTAASEYAQSENLRRSGYEKLAKEREKELQDAVIVGTVLGGGVGKVTAPKKTSNTTNTGSKKPADVAKNLDDLDAQKEPAQAELFDQPEMGRVANPYEAALGDWRVDENGMPIKADLSMEVQSLQNPLQTGLWGDELQPKRSPVGQNATLFDENGMQMEPRNLTEAIDIMSPEERTRVLQERMMGEVQSGELLGAITEANLRANMEGFGDGNPMLATDARSMLSKKKQSTRGMTEAKFTVEDTPAMDVTPSMNLKDATANLVDAIASATGAKQNFLKDGNIRAASKDFVNALWDAGSRKWSEVLAKGKELFGDSWRKIAQTVKNEWDSFVRYQKQVSAGKAGTFAIDPITFEKKYGFENSAVRDSNGKLLPTYHGTTKPFNDIKGSTEGGALGNGIYTAVRSAYGNTYAEGLGGNVHQVYVNITKPLIIDGPGDPAVNALVKLGLTKEKASSIVEKAYEEKGYITNEIRSRATKQGYDGLIQMRNGTASEIVAFNANQVKSAISPERGLVTATRSSKESVGGLGGKQGGAVINPMQAKKAVDPTKSGVIDMTSRRTKQLLAEEEADIKAMRNSIQQDQRQRDIKDLHTHIYPWITSIMQAADKAKKIYAMAPAIESKGDIAWALNRYEEIAKSAWYGVNGDDKSYFGGGLKEDNAYTNTRNANNLIDNHGNEIVSTIKDYLAGAEQYRIELKSKRRPSARELYNDLSKVLSNVENIPSNGDRFKKSSVEPTKSVKFKEDLGVSDNWLQSKLDYVISVGRDAFGVPKTMGSITGSFDRPLNLPLDILTNLKGEKGEQTNVRQDSLDYIRKNWDKVKKQPIYVEVDPFGQAWVNEGNHRIMVAKEKGETSLPVEVRYFTGGQKQTTLFAPENLIRLNSQATSGIKKAVGGPGKKQGGAVINPMQAKKALDQAVSRMIDSVKGFTWPTSQGQKQQNAFNKVPGMENTPFIRGDTPLAEGKPRVLQDKDGSSVWFLTPGRVMRQELANSELVKIVGRAFENARNRFEYQINENVKPLKKAMQQIYSSGEDMIILNDVFHRELVNKTQYTPEQLQAAGLSPKLIESYLLLRDNFDAVMVAQNKVREDMGMKKIEPLDAYLSARWKGPWAAEVYTPKGKLVTVIRESTQGGMKKAIKWVEENESGLKVKELGYVRSFAKGTDRFTNSYETIREILGKDDPIVQLLHERIQLRDKGDTENVYGQEKHFKKKTGVTGYAGKRPWADKVEDARSMFKEQIAYIENGYRWAEQQKALSLAKEYIKDPEIAEAQKNNVAYVKELIKQEIGMGTLQQFKAVEDAIAETFRGNPQAMATALGVAKSVFYMKVLGLSLPFMIVSAVQPAIAVPPALVSKKLPMSSMADGLMQGPMIFLRTLNDDFGVRSPIMENMDPFMQEAYQFARDNRVTEINQLSDIRDIDTPRSIDMLNKTVGSTISVPEMFSRSITFMTFVNALKGKHDVNTREGRLALFEEAAEATKVVLGDFNPEQKAPIFQRMGLTGNALSTLQTFLVNYAAQMWKYGKQAKGGEPIPLLTFMATNFMFAGLSGLVGIDDIQELMNFIKRHATPSTYAWMEKNPLISEPKSWLIQNTNDLFAYGPVSAMSGVNVYSRFSIGDIINVPPFESSASNIGESLFPFAAELIKSGVALTKYPFANEKGRIEAGYQLTPAGLRGLYEEKVPGMKQGNMVMQPSDIKKAQVERKPEDIGLRKTGFRAFEEQKQLDLTFANRTSQMIKDKQRADAAEKIMNAIHSREGVTDAFATWLELVGNMSTVNPAMRRYMMEMAMPELQRDTMKLKSNSPAEREKAMKAIQIMQIIQR